MTARPPPASFILPREPFDSAVRCVNEWRGRCLDAFARAECAVTQSLIALSQTPDGGQLVRLPHLVGQRFEALCTAIGQEGPFGKYADSVPQALDRFRAHDRLRTMLTHGVGEITLDAQGRWTLVLRLVSLRSGCPAQDLLAIREEEADQLREEVLRQSRSLRARLKVLCTTVRAPSDT